jgi:flagellar protein FliT
MNNQSTLLPYEEIAQLTSHMLKAARNKDWDKMRELESSCAVIISKIKTANEKVLPFGPAYQRKIASLKKIMANDLEIRNIAEPWMAGIDALMRPVDQVQSPISRYR